MSVTAQEIVELLLTVRHGLDDTRANYDWCNGLLCRIQSEGIAPPDEMALVAVNTLKYWRVLVDINPQDLAPRIEAVLAVAPKPEVK